MYTALLQNQIFGIRNPYILGLSGIKNSSSDEVWEDGGNIAISSNLYGD